MPHFASLSQKMVSTLSIKNLQKTKRYHFQTPILLAFELEQASKPFCKKVPMTRFWCKLFLMFCLTLLKNGFNFVIQKLQKTKNSPFQMFRTFVFDLKVASKPFSKKLPMTDFEYEVPWIDLISQKMVSTSPLKNL